ncbi:MAG: anthranilate phosphoribosyltransferase [Candidatus Geothermarchaeales archaeon]
MKKLINHVISGGNLSEEEAEYAMRRVMSGEATQAQIGALLTGLRMKGETVDEIAACANIMRRFSRTIKPKVKGRLVDTCGTGGDKIKTFNVSTVSALVVAGAGVPIAKHGNRSVTSMCGSADLLEGFGVNIAAEPETVKKCIEEVGIGFMFAPTFHPAMRRVLGPRREIGIRTIFNVLGPLTNPAGADAQVVGVFSPDLTEKLARVLRKLGVERAYVVNGLDGIDEISITGKTLVSELVNGVIKNYMVKPEEFGMETAEVKEILGGNLGENMLTTLRVLQGFDGAKKDMVVMNSAAAIAAGGRVRSMGEGIEVAEESIENGKAMGKLRELIEVSGGDPGEMNALLEVL